MDIAEYDLLLTDRHMPEIDGLELALLIRTAEAARGNPSRGKRHRSAGNLAA